jgi:chromosome partitioning protein
MARKHGGTVARKHMRTLAVISRKGGSGKTTLALHLAVIAAEAGLRVLLVDTDPQRSAAHWWRTRSADTPQLAETDAARLADLLAAAEADGIDLAVIDSRPSLERDAVDIARHAGFVVIPCRPGPLDLHAVGATVEVIGAGGTPGAIVINAAPVGRGGMDAAITTEARAALTGAPLPVAPVVVAQRAALSHALIAGQAVTEFEPRGRAAAELRQLWKWIEGQTWRNERH